jgi:ABC-type oligopeptide transport system ATPase subunit
MTVINLYGGPGTGKSTTSAGLFHLMKKQGYKVELVTEYAKDLVYSESFFKLKDQLMVFGKQHHRLWKLRGKVDYVITDSPLPLSLHYFIDEEPYNKDAFKNLVLSTFNSYKNINIFVARDTDAHPYQEYGRMQNELEAVLIDVKLKEMLEEYQIEYTSMVVSDTLHSDVLDFIKRT